MKCPSCGTSIGTPTMQGVTTGAFMGTQWKCIAFCCPSCDVVLSVQIDPVALKTDTVNAVLQALKAKP